MSRALRILASSLLASALTLQASFAETVERFDFEILVAPTKPTGEPWDAGSDPDIYICLSDSFGHRCSMRDMNARGAGKAWCESTICTIPDVALPDDEFSIQIFDKDLVSHDAVATGRCLRDQECNLGLATIRLTPSN